MRISSKTTLLIVAAVVAVFAAITVRERLTQMPVVAEAPQNPVTRILVAKRDLAAGSFVQGAQDLDWAPVPESAAPKASAPVDGGVAPEAAAPRENYLYEGAVKLTDFNGAVVRRSMRMGEPVQPLALMKSGEGGFMSAVLGSGMRAVSIAVTATSGNAGFVSPGDHIDLILIRRIKAVGGGSAEEVVVSETFTHDVRVVAVDQMLDNPENKAILAKTITVEVTPRQAEQIAVASETGKISIALRSLSTPEKMPEVKQAVAKDGKADKAAKDVSEKARMLGDLYGEDIKAVDADSQLGGHKNTLVPRVVVIRGDKSESVDFYQGKQ